ncbi:phosphoglucosamine mutase [Halobiforma nitratireducens]|uniref:Phosphoglucosamine mutase n=1 Tax=Halobiforma nitratireducens JCM 10879 TaxID=1227454 RepID=M0LSQ5_9EURY|nr:phosphoglucosamine mutase [Halobiforma nitratireducens]EMA35135.1 phosphoglucosamine mutase [Halobiforma nitratireducens JCM 10879]
MFGTSGIRGPVGDEVTAALALSVGRAVGSEGYETVVVGRDVRKSGELLVDAAATGLRECGTDVIEVGVESTPTVARSIDALGADAGIVVTASHNPATDNGLKLWMPSGKAFGPEQRDAIERRVREDDYDLTAWDGLGDRWEYDHARDDHAGLIAEAVSLERTPSVVVDLGNGAGAITPHVLDDLGCAVRTLNAQPDGSFPGRPSEPTGETLETLETLVANTDAEIGIAHDGDADRMVAVDETGTFVPKDALLALFARAAVRERDDRNVAVAAPVDTSLAVDDALAEAGAAVTRTKVGDVYVAERTTDDGVVFGGEPSGAWIWPAESRCPDGPLAAAKLVELVANRGPLSELVAEIGGYPIRRTSLEVEDKAAVVERVRSRLLDRYEEVDTLDGVRVETEDGWFLVRASGTEPLVRITAEARSEAAVDRVFDEASEAVEEAIERTTTDV